MAFVSYACISHVSRLGAATPTHGMAATTSLPSFSSGATRCFAAYHGLAVRAIAICVTDAKDAFRARTVRV
jgi:4-hydroxyphenylpyruvate dioxygenase